MTARTPLRRPLALALAMGLLLVSCSGDDEGTQPAKAKAATSDAEEAADAMQFPGDDWKVVEPADAGLDPAPLDELGEYLGSHASSCMAVVKGGRLVAEQYWNEFSREKNTEVFSVTKSLTSTLVGIAQDEGMLDVSEPASEYLTEWQGTPSEPVTIANLLSNDSGRFWSQRVDYGEMIAAPDRTAFSIGLTQQAEPGATWVYNNAAIQTLEAVLERATGEPVDEFAEQRLFEPIGMTAEIATDPAGNPLTFMGLQAGCTDLARFGHLFLNDGTWDGQEVLSAEWVEEATSPSQDLQAYGYLWWLNTGSDAAAGPAWEHAPADAYAALGLFEQVILILPEQEMVVVRMGANPPGAVPGQGRIVDEMARLAMESVGAS